MGSDTSVIPSHVGMNDCEVKQWSTYLCVHVCTFVCMCVHVCTHTICVPFIIDGYQDATINSRDVERYM